MKYILSGGGTGGHIYPALAIAKEIMKRDENNKILYVGKKGGLEEELVKAEKIDFAPIHVKGLPRKKINTQTIATMFSLFKGLRECDKIIKSFSPDVVIGTGGYVSAPIVMKAQQKKIKTVVQEQNAYPGKTNRFLAKRADLVVLNFEEARKYLDTDKIITTGNPIRDDFGKIYREEARKDLEISENEKLVLSFGGSGGQESTNEAIIDMIKNKYKFNFKFIHITGKVHYQGFMESIKEYKVDPNLKIFDYSYEIPKLLMASDLVIASSSAMTLAEISAVGLASILIPKAYTAGNHQVFNARSYESKDASIVILEEDLNAQSLYKAIGDLINDDERRKKMAENTKIMGSKNAVKILVDKIESL